MELVWHTIVFFCCLLIIAYSSNKISLAKYTILEKLLYDSFLTMFCIIMLNFFWYIKEISEGKLYDLLLTKTESPLNVWSGIFVWSILSYAKALIYMKGIEIQEKERFEEVMSTHKEEIVEWINKKY